MLAAFTTVLSLTLGTIVTSVASDGQFEGVHFMLNGANYSNNSYIPIIEIGIVENDNALLCITNNTNCCGLPNRAGEWFYPNGNAVPRRSVGADFHRDRGPGAVRLNRVNPASMSQTGLYRCVVPDSNGVNQTLYVYIGRENRVESVAVSRDGDQSTPLRDPSSNVTLTCVITVGSQLSNVELTPPLSVAWNGPVYGTGRFTINKIVNISRTAYASSAVLNSPGAYYDSGEYECRGDTTVGSTIVLFQVPHRPSVSVTFHGDTWLHLTWTQHPDDVVTGYQLFYSYTGSCDYSPDDVIIGSVEREYNITELEEFSEYFITLIAANETGTSPPFEGVFVTDQSVPSGSPQSFSTTPFSTNITIQWGRIDCLDRNSEITSYMIRYGPSTTNNTERNTTTVYGTNDKERVFTANRLEPLTSYTFEVAGVNRNEERGPFSSEIDSETLAPEIISMQLHLRYVSNCLQWRDTESSSRIHDIVSSTVEAVNDICLRCNLTSGDLIEPFLMCFPQSVHQVTFRAQLKDRSQATAREIVTYIEEWITSSSNGARLTAHGVRLHINNTCVVLLSTIDDPECPGYLVSPTTPPENTVTETTSKVTKAVSPNSSIVQSSNTGIIVGGVFAMVLVISATLVVTVLGVMAILKCQRVDIIEKKNPEQHGGGGINVADLRHTPAATEQQHSVTTIENIEQQGPQPAAVLVEMDNMGPPLLPKSPPNNEHQDSSVFYVNKGVYSSVNRNRPRAQTPVEEAGMQEQNSTRDARGDVGWTQGQEIKYETPDC